jgi:hypothetical protein
MATNPSDEVRFSGTALDVLGTAAELAERTKRGRITSSCLLFALAEFDPSFVTTRFVRQALNKNDRYKEEFDAFWRDGAPSTSEAVTFPGVPWKLSRNMANALTNASSWAVTTTGSPEVHTRHLVEALISPQAGTARAVLNRLGRLGVDLPTLCKEFREHVAKYAPEDNARAWDNIIGYTLITEPQSDTPPTTPDEQTTATSDAPLYKRSYSAFIPDRTSYGPRDTGIPLDDSLGVRTYASHIAQLIAAKDTFMPLSIGLFGAWGAGKSHFIDLLGEQLQSLATDRSNVFHKEIVQIRFNAWHYLDTNLWANLVSEIFEQLFNKVEDRGAKDKEKLKNLKTKLAAQSALADEAKAALRLAEGVRKGAENKLRSAMLERAKQENKVSTLLDDLTRLVVDDDLKKQLKEVADGLGLPKLEASFQELEARAEEVHSISGRTKALVLAVFTGPGWWRRALLLVVALAAPLAVSWLSVHGTPRITELLAGAGKTIAQLTMAILALSTWLAAQVKTGNSIVGKLENAYDKVSKVRAKREAEDDAARAQAELTKKIQAEEQARRTLQEAKDKLETIRTELAEMAPGRQLIRFLRARATAEDYRRHLGLVSLVRKDFEQLSTLLMAPPDPKEPLPKIDRIVLYIDDLDRCRADRVIEVLEAVHLLLAFPLFAVIVAVDPRWLRQSLLDHYPRLLGGADDEKTNARTRSLGRPATPQDYLEKIFQVPFHLHAMEETGFKSLVKVLFTVEQPKKTDSTPATTKVAAGDSSQGEATEQPGPETSAGDTSSEEKPTESREAPKVDVTQLAAPERLLLTQNEVDDVERFQLLFQTPRALKRFANTYSLIRVGVDEKHWSNYLGFDHSPPGYRVPLLLLAVTSAFPSLARPWLLWLSNRETPPIRWQLEDKDVNELFVKYSDTTDRQDWEKLKESLDRIKLDGWPVPDTVALNDWVPRVARYSF